MKVIHKILFFNHGTETSAKAEKFLRDKHEVTVGKISGPKPKDQSWEEYWRNERNKFFQSRKSFIITAHHLDDAVETYVWSSMHGTPKTPLYFNGLVYRPFMLNRKDELINWAKRRNVSWIEDESNKDTAFQRNYVRHVMMPHVLKINKGIHKVVKKKILSQYKESGNE